MVQAHGVHYTTISKEITSGKTDIQTLLRLETAKAASGRLSFLLRTGEFQLFQAPRILQATVLKLIITTKYWRCLKW